MKNYIKKINLMDRPNARFKISIMCERTIMTQNKQIRYRIYRLRNQFKMSSLNIQHMIHMLNSREA